MKSRQRRGKVVPDEPGFVFSDLTDTGRLHFFYHSPSSTLPVRDVLGEQGQGAKSEPHIEKSAENYCACCYQRNILGLLRSREKYLFLFTTCKAKDSSMRCYRGQRFVVGYMVKEKALPRRNRRCKWWAVKGATRLYSFADAFPLSRLVKGSRSTHLRLMKLDETETKKLLCHFKGCRNRLKACIAEVKRLGAKPRTRGLSCNEAPSCKSHC